MATPPTITIATRDYDFVAPLALADVGADGLDLRLLRSFDALQRFGREPAIDGAEASFSQYLRRVASGDRSLVGLPVFIMREFRHRCFFVRRDSDLIDVTHLRGRRIATDAWGASGNTWSRAILRERGVPLDSIQWMVGPVDPGDGPRPSEPLPPGVAPVPAGRAQSDLLLAGEIDAMMCPWPPRVFDQPNSPIRRLYPDYRSVEREYFRRTGLYPGHHIIVLRRTVVDRYPRAAPALYRAFVAARDLSEQNHRMLHETSPWVLADLEEQSALMGPGFRPYGYPENRTMVAAFCEEQLAQGLIKERLDPGALFGEFQRLLEAEAVNVSRDSGA